jgi:hypothetical protein
MSVVEIAGWSTFFSVVAQIGATLAGLLFVGLTISLQHVLASRGYLSRAFSALYMQLEVLLVGILGLIPGQSAPVLGTELLVVSLLIFSGITIFAYNFPEDETSKVLGGGALVYVRNALYYSGTLFPASAGLALILGWRYALYLVVPGVIACIYPAIGYAWAFAVEIPRRAADKKDNTL